MKCPDNGFVQAYIDGESDITKRKEFEYHLQKCKKCSETYLELKTNDDFIIFIS